MASSCRLRSISLPPQDLQDGLEVPLHVHVLSFPTHGQPDQTVLPRHWLNAADAVRVDPYGLGGGYIGELNNLVDIGALSPSTQPSLYARGALTTRQLVVGNLPTLLRSPLLAA